jgi:hypothetical protein
MTEQPLASGKNDAATDRGYEVTITGVKSYLLSVVAIIVATAPAVFIAWLIATAMELSGVSLAIVTVFTAMILSVVFFAGLVVLGRSFKIIK